MNPVPDRASSRPRVAIVATGSELVRGDRRDRNGPFLAGAVLSCGLDPARITIVGDDPDDLEAVLRDGFQADLCVVSGGLGCSIMPFRIGVPPEIVLVTLGGGTGPAVA